MRIQRIKHSFVEYVPDILDDGVLYVSIPFCIATHKCFCGCGWEVTTPIAPKAWELTYNGQSVSLSPSVGNRNLECKSHYWVRKDRVDWLLPLVEPWPKCLEGLTRQEDAERGFVKRVVRRLKWIRGWRKQGGPE